MGGSVPAIRRNASLPAASFGREILKIEEVQNCGKKLPGYSFGRLARYLWPVKTPAAVEFYTGMAERTARHVASDKSDPSSSELVKVLDSDQGERALEWIMRDSDQAWWFRFKEDRRHGNKRREADREIAQGQLF